MVSLFFLGNSFKNWQQHLGGMIAKVNGIPRAGNHWRQMR
jgi:hypothetical protein